MIRQSVVCVIVLTSMLGCKKLTPVADDTVPSKSIPSGTPSANERPIVAVSAPKQPVAKRDQFGNFVRLYARNARAVVTAEPESTAIVRPAVLGEVLYLFGPGSSGDWLQIGSDPRGNACGYIRSADVFATSHPECMRLRSETLAIRRPVEVFAEFETLQARLRSETTDAQPDWIESPITFGTRELPVVPLIETRAFTLAGTTVKLMRIATYTWNPTGRVTPTLVSAVPPREMLLRVDVLLIVDATGSMMACWRSLQKHLAALIEELRRKSSLDAHVSVIAYRDYQESEFVTKRLDLTKDLNAVQKWLDGMNASSGGDWEEAMFDAVLEGIQETKWRQGSLRFAILAANNAGHEPSDPQNPKRISLESLCASAAKSRVAVMCLQFPYDAKYKGETDRLPHQLTSLAKASGGNHIVITPGDSESPASLMRYFETICSSQGQLANEQLAVYDSIVSGDDSALRGYNLPKSMMAMRRRELTARLGDDPARLVVAERGSVGFESGWTIFSQEAWELCVLIRKEELELLVKLCDAIITSGPERPEQLARMLRVSTGAVTGDDIVDEATLDVELKLRGIPMRPDTLLQFSLAELTAMPRASRLHLAKMLEVRYRNLCDANARCKPDDSGNIAIPAHCLP
jgi:hypothetical protein